MKHIITAVFIFLLYTNSYSQDSVKLPTIEIDFGLNHLFENEEVNSKFGFGLSIKRIWFSDNRINLISGLLIEQTRYHQNYVQCGHFCHYEDMRFNIYSFSIPLMLRASTGSRYKFFIESGPTFEIIPLKWGKGTEVTYPPPNNISKKEITGDFEHDLTDFGANVGVGIIFPLNNYNFTLVTAYHNNIKSILEKQQNILTKYISVKIGIAIN